MTVVVGLDSSLTSYGLARLDLPGLIPDPSVRVSRLTSKPPPADEVTLDTRSHRLRRLAGGAFNACAGADLVMIEGPSYASDSGAAHDRAGLWWMVVGRLTGQGYTVVEVPPSTVKVYATGNGGAPKDQVLAAVIRRYPAVEVSGNDEADALVLAAMGARHLGQPIEPDLPQTHLRAMKAVKWPTRQETA